MTRHLSLRPDYDAFPVWESGMVRPESLPMTEQLRVDLQSWNDEWADTEGVSPDVFERPATWDVEAFNERGRLLAGRLGHELGADYEVVLVPLTG